MGAMIKTGYMKCDLKINRQGAMTPEEANVIRNAILDAVDRLELNLNIEGTMSFIQIDTFELNGKNA